MSGGGSSGSVWLRKLTSHGIASLFGASTCFAVLFFVPPSKNERADDVTGANTNINSDANIDNGNNRKSLSQPPRSQSQQSVSVSNMSPTPPITLFTPNPNLSIAFDARTKNPAYVTERLPRQSTPSSESDPKYDNELRARTPRRSFYEETRLPPSHRSRNGYYRNSGFDRGHLAAAADFDDREAVGDTFSLSNVSPQRGVFNRVVWARLEDLVRRRCGDECGEEEVDEVTDAYVVTGPLWLPNGIEQFYDGDGDADSQRASEDRRRRRDWYRYSHVGFGSPPSIVQVPTHFFKIICTISTPSSSSIQTQEEHRSPLPHNRAVTVRQFAAFVIPNSNFEKHPTDTVSLRDYLVRPSDLEAASGLQFFPTLRAPQSNTTRDDAGSNAMPQPHAPLELWDRLTEEVWAEDDTGSSTSSIGINRSTRPPSSLDLPSSLPAFRTASGARTDRSRKLRVRGGASARPLGVRHLCKDGGCDELVRVRRK